MARQPRTAPAKRKFTTPGAPMKCASCGNFTPQYRVVLVGGHPRTFCFPHVPKSTTA